MAEKSTKKYTMDLCEGPILKKIILFSLPLMASSVLQLLFNAVDVMVVGKFAGDDALAAVGSNGPIVNLIVNVFMGLSIGTNVLAARYFAGKKDEELRKTVHTAIMLSLICGVILIAVGGLAAKQLLIWTQSPPEVIDLATLYLRIYFLGMPASMLYNFGAAILRGVGDTKRPLYYLTFAGVVNVVLNLLFVIVFHMDVAGVAIATVISQCISAVLIIRCLMKESGAIRLERKYLGIDKGILIDTMKIGIPAGVQSSMFSLSNVVVQSSINSFGNVIMAGNAAAQNIESFLAMTVKALSQASVAFLSQNIGAGKFERVNKILGTLLMCVVVVDGSMSLLAYLFGRPLLSLYSNSVEVIEAGMIRITITYVLHVGYGLMEVMAGALRGMGHSVMPMVVSLLGVCAFRVAWITLLFQNEAFHTIQTIYYAYPISWFVTLAVHIVCFLVVSRKFKRG